MTPRQIEIVQSTWAQLEPIADQAARLFYRRLFEIAPRVRPMIRTSISEQGERFVETLSLTVRGIGQPGAATAVIEDCGRRHEEFGGQPELCDAAVEALLWALEQGLGGAFTPEAREAWDAIATTLAGVMIRSANEATLASPELALA